jgi:uncharacterized membrane protein YhaH (DUF805 family)
MNWYLAVLKKYAVFSGRSRRKEYWTFVLINLLIVIALGIVTGIIASVSPTIGSVFSAIASLYSLAVLLPGIGVVIRRLHDTGRSGWFWLIGLIPLIGAIILIIFLAEDSKPGENQYGPNPKS